MENLFDMVYDNGDEVLQETMKILTEANIVRMDKATLKKRLITQATLVEAKLANDSLYQKYAKATLIRRKCRKLIQEKYASKGVARARMYLKNRKKDLNNQETDK